MVKGLNNMYLYLGVVEANLCGYMWLLATALLQAVEEGL